MELEGFFEKNVYLTQTSPTGSYSKTTYCLLCRWFNYILQLIYSGSCHQKTIEIGLMTPFDLLPSYIPAYNLPQMRPAHPVHAVIDGTDRIPADPY